MHKFLVLAISLFLTSCNESSTSPVASTAVTLPNVSFTCTTAADCADNSANTKTTSIMWYQNSVAKALGFVIATSCAGGTCTGAVTTWFDPNTLSAITTLPAGNYNVYGCTDTDTDGTCGGSGEPESLQYAVTSYSLAAGASTVSLTTWTDHP